MNTFHRVKHTLKRIVRRNSVASQVRRRIIMRFVNKVGFVYFGSVDSQDDEHHIVRGMTVSTTHQDEHYSVGSIDGYDVSLVDRTDLIGTDVAARQYSWLLFEFDLHSTADIPHAAIIPLTTGDGMYTQLLRAFPALQPTPLGTFEEYSLEYTKRFETYTTPTHFIEVERYFSSEVTRYIAAHFWPLAVEVSEGSLYIYASEALVNAQLLETMLRCGLWLAERLDSVEV